jgi:transcriptional regulator with XRE-family HTH domain
MKTQGLKIAENLRRLLFKQDLTPTELARQIGIPQQTIQRIVKNKIKRPHAKTLSAIADFFKIDISELTGDAQNLFLSKEEQVAKPEGLVIPVYEWPQLESVYQKKQVEPSSRIFAMPTYSSEAYGAVMSDSSMSPYFAKDTILIIEPNQQPKDRVFVLVYLHQSKKIIFRQLLSDGENYFLKALSADLASFPIRKLEESDNVMGVLVETRQTHFKSMAIAGI